MKPCEVLEQIQTDLQTIVKSVDVPYERTYTLAPGADLHMSIELEKDELYHLVVSLSNSREETTEPTFRKLAPLVPILIWKVLSSYLLRSNLSPCPTMAHCGADEILALYKCLGTLNDDLTLPFAFPVSGPVGTYNLFMAREKNNHCELVFETNYIYGKSFKCLAEVEFMSQTPERAERILTGALGEWLRPDYTKSLRMHS